jgi:hypothetical protein
MLRVINALDHLNAEQRRQVLDRTLVDSVAKELNDATRKAIQDKADLYIPAGLWIIEATGTTVQRDPKTIGWTIDVPAQGTFRAFGDGEATMIQRRAVPFLNVAPWTTNFADFDFLVRIIPNEGISIELDGLLLDGNERNCPVIDPRPPRQRPEDPPISPSEPRLQEFPGGRTSYTYQFSGSPGDVKTRYGVVVKYADNRKILQTAATINRKPDIPHTVFFFAAPPDDAKVLIYNASNFEHCANIGFAKVEGIPDLVRLHRITMRGCVGDGLFVNRPIRRLVVTDFRSSGRTRRRRFDITLSQIPIVNTVIDGFDGDSFASEPLPAAENSSMFLENMHVRGSFGLASGKIDPPSLSPPILVTGRNIKSLMQHGFGERNSQIYNVSGIFTDCEFAGLKDIRESRTTFHSCRFTLTLLPDLNGGNSAAQPLGITHLDPKYRADFIDCTFSAPNLTSGEYVVIKVEEVLRPEIIEEPTTQFINCRGVEQLDRFVRAEGFVVIFGGSLPGRDAAIYIARSGNRGVRFIGLYKPEEWTCRSLLKIDRGLRFATTIDLSGSFNAERIDCVVFKEDESPRSEPQITWTGQITGRIKIVPPWDRIRGMPGLILENSDNGVFFYDARPDFKTFGNKIYRISL